MKNVVCIFLASITLMGIAGCSRLENNQSKIDNGYSLQAESQLSKPTDSSSQSEDLLSVDNESTPDIGKNGFFTLGKNEEVKAVLEKGDTFGEWKVADIEYKYDPDDKLNMLKANFMGNVTLTGIVKRNDLFENGYNFIVSDSDFSKMPHFNYYDANPDNGTIFLMNFADEITNAPNFDMDEELKCTITVSEYNYIFVYTMAPAKGTVTQIVYN
ncbi:MAG: hypothetical protein PHG02_08150 [Oscillospiraceae bacterium]|nr:hypothetical protein [Oscillospiraceae bacterium]